MKKIIIVVLAVIMASIIGIALTAKDGIGHTVTTESITIHWQDGDKRWIADADELTKTVKTTKTKHGEIMKVKTKDSVSSIGLGH